MTRKDKKGQKRQKIQGQKGHKRTRKDKKGHERTKKDKDIKGQERTRKDKKDKNVKKLNLDLRKTIMLLLIAGNHVLKLEK